MHFSRILRLPLATLLISVAALIASAPTWAPLFEFSRSAIAEGELWRLLSGHLSHWSSEHLVFDLVAFVLLGVMAERSGRLRFIALVTTVALAISAGILFARTDLDFYRGLSGIDSALFVAVCGDSLRRALQGRDRTGVALSLLLLIGFAGKLTLEAITGDAIFVADSEGASLVWLAHGVGAAAGLFAFAGSIPLGSWLATLTPREERRECADSAR